MKAKKELVADNHIDEGVDAAKPAVALSQLPPESTWTEPVELCSEENGVRHIQSMSPTSGDASEDRNSGLHELA